MKILIVGDSFVEGVRAEGNIGWAQILQRETSSVNDVSSSGIGGNTIFDISERLKSLEDEYDLVLLGVGLNDSRFRTSKQSVEVSKVEFQLGLKNFIKTVRGWNEFVQIHFVGLALVDEGNPYTSKDDKVYINSNICDYDKVIQGVANEMNVGCVDLSRLVFNYRDFWSEDGLHPTNRGHEKIYDEILTHLGW